MTTLRDTHPDTWQPGWRTGTLLAIAQATQFTPRITPSRRARKGWRSVAVAVVGVGALVLRGMGG